MKKFLYLFLLMFTYTLCLAQDAELRGVVSDDEGVPFPDVTVLLFQDANVAGVSLTDSIGFYSMSSITPGNYMIQVSIPGYSTQKQYIKFYVGKSEIRNISMSSSNDTLPTAKVTGRRLQSEDVSGEIDKEQLEHATGTGVIDVIKVNPKVRIQNGRAVVGVGRPTGTGIMFNNVSIIGPSPITTDGMQAISILDNGVSARYGGFSGGAIRYTPSLVGLKDLNAFRFQSSSPFNGYHFNQVTFMNSRALKIDRGNQEGRAFVKWGTSFLAIYDFKKDPRPVYGGSWKVTDETAEHLSDNPLTSSEVVGAQVSSASFLSEEDLERVQARDNAYRHNASAQFQVYHQPNWRSRIQWINRYQYRKQRLPSFNNQLLNSQNNPTNTNHFIHSQLIYKNRVKTPYDRYGKPLKDDAYIISSLKYSLEVDFQRNFANVQHDRHRDEVFDYGYIGKFVTKRAPVYNYVENSKRVYDQATDSFYNLRGYWEFSGFTDTAVQFSPSDRNLSRANFTSALLDVVGETRNIGEIQQSGAVINGYNIPNVYSLFFDQGSITGNYSKSQNSQLFINAYTEIAVHPFRNKNIRHDLEFGLSFRKENRSYYNLAANNLWQLMPLLVNDHISYDDQFSSYRSRDQNGNFTDTLQFNAHVDAESQKVFDKRLRARLIEQGKATETSFIDINSLDPDDLSLEDFSADELLNNGNPYAFYAGYDHTGKKRASKSGINSFLNNPLSRSIDAYRPLEIAAWIQDKFVFKDLIVRAGVRLERFDANQAVLSDPYLLYATHTAGEVSELSGVETNHPSQIGDNYVVYVNDAESPSSITGYRNGDLWYDADGLELSDATLIANRSQGGSIQPYLIDPENRDLNSNAFSDYQTKIMALPRVNFSFPLNSTALFYFYYDKLAQYPSQRTLFAPYSDYLEMETASNRVFANPSMKPRVKTEYLLGYKQFLGEKSTIDISASYAFVKNDFNQFRMEYAYPYAYTTYSNIDFSTNKSLIASYEYRGDHLYMNMSYALQFSEGTGSNVNSAAALLQVGQPNLRSLYPMDFDQRHNVKGSLTYRFGQGSKTSKYRGPYVGKNAVLKNSFITIGFQALSGTPYTRIVQAVPTAQGSMGVAIRPQTLGNPLGSRLPWQFNTDVRIEKSLILNGGENKLNLYAMVTNLLDNRIVQGVYSYTGLSTDDGYLNSPAGQQQLESQLDAQAFAMLYKTRLSENYNLSAPRNIQIGCRFDF